MLDSARTWANAGQRDFDLGLQARRRGDRSAALMHFLAVAAVEQSVRAEIEIAREMEALQAPRSALVHERG